MVRKEDIKMTIAEAVQRFNQVYLRNRKTGDSKYNFYCGITNDIERREGEHNANYLDTLKCQNADTAKDLEAALHDEGYDTGDKVGNGTDESIYVYIYRKTQTTVE